MTTARINFATALAPGARLTPVILIAGVPSVLTAAGVRPTTVAVTAGTVDALWWPGTGTLTETLPGAVTFDPVEDLLDPGEVFEVHERASLLKGDVRVEALTFSVMDTDGRGTALLSVREGRSTQLLASEVSATATSIPLDATGGFPASGIAAIGRETVTYSSTGGGSLLSVTRGKYGSSARSHGAPAEHRPLVSAAGPRHWQSRLATVWLCVLSADGLTLTDPTMLYAGTVGAGVQLKGNLSRWSVPLDHVTESLSRKIDTPPLDLYGWAHYTLGPHPLLVGAAVSAGSSPYSLSLQWSATDPADNSGWHPSREAFVAAANSVFATGTTGAGRIVLTGGRVVVSLQGSNASPRWLSAQAAWDTYVLADYRVDDDSTPALWGSATLAPEAFFPLFGWVKIPSATDYARLPTDLEWSYTTADGAIGSASVALVAETRGGKDFVALVMERDGTRQAVRVLPTTARDPLCLRRTPAKLGIVARGASVVAALRAGARGIDALTGQDLYESCVDWDAIERAFAAAPAGGLPQFREYRFIAGRDSFLAVLIDELRLRGMCLAMRYGRITGVRLASLSDVENTAASIIETDQLSEGGRELPVEVIDNAEPLATSIRFSVPTYGGPVAEVAITDTTFQSEFGDGEAVECRALLALPEAVALDVVGTLAPLYAVAQQILGPMAEPSRAVRLTLSGALLALQPGDLVAFTHSRIPTWAGVRGHTAAVCQVQEVRRQYMGGRLRAVAVLRLQSSSASAYTPEVIVALGGLTGGSAVVTIDATTGWGAQCHAQDLTPAGELSTNALDGFAVGDVVTLSALDDRTPIADEQRTVTAVGTTTLTLSSAPSAGMVTQAATQYGVSVRWAGYDAATARQHLGWAWIAAAAAGTLGAGADNGKRWAS